MSRKSEYLVTSVKNGQRMYDVVKQPSGNEDVVGDYKEVSRAAGLLHAADGTRILVLDSDKIDGQRLATYIGAEYVGFEVNYDQGAFYDFYTELGRMVLSGEDIPRIVTDAMFHFVQNHEQTFHQLYKTYRSTDRK